MSMANTISQQKSLWNINKKSWPRNCRDVREELGWVCKTDTKDASSQCRWMDKDVTEWEEWNWDETCWNCIREGGRGKSALRKDRTKPSLEENWIESDLS